MALRLALGLSLLSLLGACLAGASYEEAIAAATGAQSGDVAYSFVDQKTGLRWSTKVSPRLPYSKAERYCSHLGSDWRLPTVGELETTLRDVGDTKVLRREWATHLPAKGILFSGEVIPVIDDDKQPWVMNIVNGHTYNGHGKDGYVRCVYGEVTRSKPQRPELPTKLVGPRWWKKRSACPPGSTARGSIGTSISCRRRDGTRHGRSTSWMRGRSERYYRNGRLNGKKTDWRTDGSKRSESHYRRGELHGLSRYWYKNGKKASETRYADGLLHGRSRQWDENGRLVQQLLARKARVIEMLHYRDGKLRDGYVEDRYPNGAIRYRGQFRSGIAIGVHLQFHENGRPKKEKNFDENGIPHGRDLEWSETGHPKDVGQWHNGALEGVRTLYDREGKILVRFLYKDGKAVERRFGR
jgi:antitoxin component YwqK of YwqJK toxin-antitoxin module